MLRKKTTNRFRKNFPQILGWTANIFFIYGVYALGNQEIIGWYANMIGNLLYVVQGYKMKNTPLTVLSFALIILNIKGIIEWSS